MSGADSYEGQSDGGQSDGGQSVGMLRWQSCIDFGILLEATQVVVCTRVRNHKVLVCILDSTTGTYVHTSQHHRYLCSYLTAPQVHVCTLDSTTDTYVHT